MRRNSRTSRSIARTRGTAFLLLAGLVAVACASEEGRVECLFTDEECIEDARLRGAEVVLVDAEGNPVDGAGAAVEDPSHATISGDAQFWRLEAEETEIHGTIGFVGRGEGRMAVQLVSDDAVNVLLVMPEEGREAREVEEALLAFGRGPTCALVRSDPPFRVRLVASEGPWVAGRYAGMLACPDYSALTVSGAFRVRTEEEG